jgi:hypothetical protein
MSEKSVPKKKAFENNDDFRNNLFSWRTGKNIEEIRREYGDISE